VLTRAFDAWFLALADPARSAPPPARGPRALDARQLCRLAERHGVLPALARNLRRFAAQDPVSQPVTGLAGERLRLGAGLSLRIRKQLGAIASAFAAAGCCHARRLATRGRPLPASAIADAASRAASTRASTARRAGGWLAESRVGRWSCTGTL